jgi:hypothetical protein
MSDKNSVTGVRGGKLQEFASPPLPRRIVTFEILKIDLVNKVTIKGIYLTSIFDNQSNQNDQVMLSQVREAPPPVPYLWN